MSNNFRPGSPFKSIVHIDMDAFFASIEQRDRRGLRGKPVVVGAAPKGGRGRGVVSTCSYEARKFGIHSAMPISSAYKRCPGAIFLPVNMDKYRYESEEIYKLLYQFTPEIEPVSIDEAFLDITGSYHLFSTAFDTCVAIKKKIKEERQLVSSIGLAPNKMLAKIASDLSKPDGLLVVRPEEIRQFLEPLSIDKIWGLGKKGKEVLNRRGIYKIRDLVRLGDEEMRRLFGKNGELFYKLARGIDEREVEGVQEPKSVSNEITFEEDTCDCDLIESSLSFLCEKVSTRLRKNNLKGRTVSIKVRLADFSTRTRSMTLIKGTNFNDIIYKAAYSLYRNLRVGGRVRLVGVKVSELIPAKTRDSFLDNKRDERFENLYKAIEKINNKFGGGSVSSAKSSYFKLNVSKYNPNDAL
ncbi:MAG: DNA polymerase IV [Candidatus Omnitrophica bacterium]|nr:DNA polymerase IV [Candidatus Omnitrophota bacterium]MBD3269440.1 DNA polymerase IV [Candidatus Omnitrophota bacterium]